MDNNVGIGNLAKKLAEVSAAVGTIEKTGYNSFQKYSYATEANILEAIRSELTSRGVFVFSSVVNSDFRVLNEDKNEHITTVYVQYTFVDSESGETFTVNSMGQGVDKQDKGVYKALTGANKYMFLKNFMLPTGDDPEATNSEGKSTASRAPANITAVSSDNRPSRFADRKTSGKKVSLRN